MKQLNIYFEDKEFEKLVAKKGKLSWHDLVMSVTKK